MNRIELAKMLGLELDYPCGYGCDTMPDENTIEDVLSDLENGYYKDYSFCKGKIEVQFYNLDTHPLRCLNTDIFRVKRYEEIVWGRAADIYLDMVYKTVMRLGGD